MDAPRIWKGILAVATLVCSLIVFALGTEAAWAGTKDPPCSPSDPQPKVGLDAQPPSRNAPPPEGSQLQTIKRQGFGLNGPWEHLATLPLETTFTATAQQQPGQVVHPIRKWTWMFFEMDEHGGDEIRPTRGLDDLITGLLGRDTWSSDRTMTFRKPGIYNAMAIAEDVCGKSGSAKMAYTVYSPDEDPGECQIPPRWLNRRDDGESNTPPVPGLNVTPTSKLAYDQGIEYYPVPTVFKLDGTPTHDGDIAGWRRDHRHLCFDWHITYTAGDSKTTEEKQGAKVIANPMSRCWPDKLRYRSPNLVPPCKLNFQLTVSDGIDSAQASAEPANEAPVAYRCAMEYHKPTDSHPCTRRS